jgi:hypothetical protein
MLVPMVVLFFAIGLFPNLLLDKINPSVTALIQRPAVAAALSGPQADLFSAGIAEEAQTTVMHVER